MQRLAISVFFILTCASLCAQPAILPLNYNRDNLLFEWALAGDSAKLSNASTKSTIWRGSLLPGWWLLVQGQKKFVKAAVISASATGDKRWTLQLRIGDYGKGVLKVGIDSEVLRLEELTVDWTGEVPAIISMYFGATALNIQNSAVLPGWDKPFVPDWQAMGFCVPGAKEGPAQSYFRSWDFGQANIALGSFGPSLGSPYGAAYPRPLLYAGMGNNEGFIALGAGSIPDGAMSLHLLGARGCFEYLYNEDIWGALPGKSRTWQQPLRISIAENAWQAFQGYYSTFPQRASTCVNAVKPSWNCWGTWAQQQNIIPPIADAAKKAGATMFELDGSWEATVGSATVNQRLFPHFMEDAEAARSAGMDIGIWQSIGWVADPFTQGLTDKDLLLNAHGKPCKANWNFDPFEESNYCLDPSSANARQYLTARTIRLMNLLHPKLLKLDFGYGLPAPYMAVPRDPAYRGEQYAYKLVEIIAAAAKRIDPDVAIMYYGISPLWTGLQDLVSLDDQGDLWYDARQGHGEWSIWASLLGGRNLAINGSSGYHWEQDDEAILNTAIIGAPGSVLPVYGKDQHPVSSKYMNRRLAIDSWFRKTTSWKPLWLNSRSGDFNNPPVLNSWGRLEKKDSAWVLTALVLRDQDKEKIVDAQVDHLRWSGRWVLLSQDEKDVLTTGKLALIPFDPGSISLRLPGKPSRISRYGIGEKTDFTNWQWEDGQVKIQIDSALLDHTAGFIIERH